MKRVYFYLTNGMEVIVEMNATIEKIEDMVWSNSTFTCVDVFGKKSIIKMKFVTLVKIEEQE